MLHPKKVGTLPIENSEDVKRTNEIKTAIPLLQSIDIDGKDITTDAMLTQWDIGEYIVSQGGHYHFIVKQNQPGVFNDIAFYFESRKEPDYTDYGTCEHGRIEVRKIWTTTELNGYLHFPHVGQAFVIERESTNKKSGEHSKDIAYGITSRPSEQADSKRVLEINRGHWCIENSCHYIIDWNFDEDRSRIRSGYGPENMTRLRRLAISIIKSKGARSVAQKMRRLTFNVRAVFDYFRMTKNSCAVATAN
jgi:predicted transposase YbfD/YdcC